MSILGDIIGRLKRPKILVLGDLLLDRYVWGTTQRISAEAPVQVLEVDREEYRAGGAANVAANAASLGADVYCGGVIGKDPAGEQLTKILKDRCKDTWAILRDRERRTSVKTRMISHNQQMLRVDQEDRRPIGPSLEKDLLKASLKAEARCELTILSDYDKGTLTEKVCRDFIKDCQGPVLVGLKGGDYKKFTGVTGASLNRKELLAITGEADVDRGAIKLVKELWLEFLVVTLGKDGMSVYSHGDSGYIAPFTLPSAARQVFDVSGAGDTILAAFAVAYASKATLREAAQLANAAAGIVVSKVGTATVTRDELQGHRKIVKLPELIEILGRERQEGKKIVFTNGCFDLIHAGHASLLEHCQSHGNILVLGLNSDDSVRRLKGQGRPIVSQEYRAQLLAAFEAVSYVILFEEDTPERLIQAIRPDVLIKGEDYSLKQIVGSEHSGRVALAPFVKGLSSSEIIKRIQALPPNP